MFKNNPKIPITAELAARVARARVLAGKTLFDFPANFVCATNTIYDLEHARRETICSDTLARILKFLNVPNPK